MSPPMTARADGHKRVRKTLLALQQIGDAPAHGGCLAERGAGRHLERHLELAAVEVRHEGAAHAPEDDEADGDRKHGGAHHRDAMPQRPIEGPAHNSVQRFESAVRVLKHPAQPVTAPPLLDGRVVPARGEHAVKREGDEERHQHRESHRHSELVEEPADDAAHERHGHHHHRGEDRLADGQVGKKHGFLGLRRDVHTFGQLQILFGDDHAAYLGHWLNVLKEDQRANFSAAAHAQRAADFLNGLQPPRAMQPRPSR